MDDKIKKYDVFFVENYSLLRSFAKKIDSKNDYESLLHDVFLRCRKHIECNGYKGDDFLNFVRVSLYNFYKSDYKVKQKWQIFDIDDPNFTQTIDQELLDKEEDQLKDDERFQKISYINSQIFEYVDKYYTARENFVFKTYYLLKHKKLNYAQLSQATGYSITSVSNIIKKIKKDLRDNLEVYINTGEKMEALLKEVESLLLKNSSMYYSEYLIMYKRIFGRGISGCKCNRSKVVTEITNWYNQNKTK